MKETSRGMVKINWNVAIDNLNKKIGVGVIARDDEGWVLAFMCTTMLLELIRVRALHHIS
jgi:hypothetical protein